MWLNGFKVEEGVILGDWHQLTTTGNLGKWICVSNACMFLLFFGTWAHWTESSISASPLRFNSPDSS